MRDFTLIFGCMFAGKTTHLIGFYNDSSLDINEKLVVKPLIDNRYSEGKVSSHTGLQMTGHRISKAEEIFPLITPHIREVYIDEVQFLGPYIIEVIGEMMMNGVRVIAAGLDKDYLNRDFGPMKSLKRLATEKIELSARCHVCQKSAHFTYRTSLTNELVVVGHNNSYEARCKEHWEQGMLETQRITKEELNY